MTEEPTKKRNRWTAFLRAEEPKERNRSAAVLNGITAALLALSLGLIVGGVVWPGGEAPPNEEPPPFGALAEATPTRLFIPAIKINSAIVPIENDANRVLQVPPDPKVVGWWRVSAMPGATRGQTLLTGHAVRDGSGPLNRLPQLTKGKPIDVITQEGRMRYQVTHVREWTYDKVNEKAEELFGQDVAKGRLVLVSCTDWDGQKWNKNVIVFGKPLGEPRKAIEKQREREAEREAEDAGRQASPAL